jgi:hypothetical protein
MAKYNEDGTINTNYVAPEKVDHDADSDLPVWAPDSRTRQGMRRQQQDRARERKRYERKNASVESRNKRVAQQELQATRTAAMRKAMSAAPYTNKVQEAKKKQKAKMKQKMKRSYYSG